MLFDNKNNFPDFKTAKGFEKIYKTYFKKVFGICFYQTKNRSVDEEMTQDIFQSLWKRRNELKIKESIEHYLVRAAKLEVMDYYRTKANREKHLKYVHEDYSDSTNNTEEELSFSELAENLDLLINKLPFQCKNVFTLSREQGMNNKEIALTLLISEKAVEYHITRALSFLRKHIIR